MKLISQEMVDEMLKRAEEPEARAAFKGLNIALFLVATDCPGNEDRQVKLIIKEGKLLDVEVIIKSAPSDLRTAPLDKSQFDAKVLAPFKKLTDIVQGKVSMISSIGYLNIDGDLPKLLKQVNGYMARLKFMGTLPIEWGS